jgi:large subunit ribosomal protein L15
VKLHELKPATGSRKKEKRIGRGPGSGHGKTSTKGHKGHLARVSGGKGPGFEGGQMPLIRRIPKRGFYSHFRKEYVVLNLKKLLLFKGSDPITPELLKEAGLIKSIGAKINVLGDGEIKTSLVIKAHSFSRSAIEKIQKAGGKAEIIQ